MSNFRENAASKTTEGWYNPFCLVHRDTYVLKDIFSGQKRELEVLFPPKIGSNSATTHEGINGEVLPLESRKGFASIGGRVREVKIEIRSNSSFRDRKTGYTIQMTVPNGDSYRYYTVERAEKYDEHPSTMVCAGFEDVFGLPIVDYRND